MHRTKSKPTSCISMKMQVIKQKLLFLFHLIKLEDKSLAKEIFETQKSLNLPGLVNECRQMLKDLKLPNILENSVADSISKLTWKKLVRNAVLNYEECELKKEISDKSKLVDGPMAMEDFQRKPYLSNLTMQNARMQFKIRSKLNFSAKYEREMWLCDSCCSAIESQSHILFCPAYAELRSGKDLKEDKDLIEYVRKVMEVRIKLKLKK